MKYYRSYKHKFRLFKRYLKFYPFVKLKAEWSFGETDLQQILRNMTDLFGVKEK